VGEYSSLERENLIVPKKEDYSFSAIAHRIKIY
jgi:hypothetical protein